MHFTTSQNKPLYRIYLWMNLSLCVSALIWSDWQRSVRKHWPAVWSSVVYHEQIKEGIYHRKTERVNELTHQWRLNLKSQTNILNYPSLFLPRPVFLFSPSLIICGATKQVHSLWMFECQLAFYKSPIRAGERCSTF